MIAVTLTIAAVLWAGRQTARAMVATAEAASLRAEVDRLALERDRWRDAAADQAAAVAEAQAACATARVHAQAWALRSWALAAVVTGSQEEGRA